MLSGFYDQDILWMIHNAPQSMQKEIMSVLTGTMLSEYRTYLEAKDKGYIEQMNNLVNCLLSELSAVKNKDENFVFNMRKVSTYIYTELCNRTEPNQYIRICAYGNNKLTITFVSENGTASSSKPSLFSDEDELAHKIDTMPIGTFCYYKTVYLKDNGNYLF